MGNREHRLLTQSSQFRVLDLSFTTHAILENSFPSSEGLGILSLFLSTQVRMHMLV